MKNLTQIKWILLFVVCAATAQQEKGITGSSNWLTNWTEFKPAKTDYNDTNRILFGKITTNTTWSKKYTYLLQGNVYVTNNAVLTIEPGTIIKGDSESYGMLIVTKGARIIADGKETDPIIFTSNSTSRKAGDWGGIILLGDAPINKLGGTSTLNLDVDVTQTVYGGTNILSNSGIMRYVRIEFAGKKVKGQPKIDALTLAGVGSKTVIENVMVSFSGGNSFEIKGGDLCLSKLVSYRCNYDDFEFTQGTQCYIENSLAIRHSYLTSSTGSRCFKTTSYDKKEEMDFAKNKTDVIATNVTLVNGSETLNNDIKLGLVKEAIYVGENTTFAIKKSVISGFNPAVILDNKIQVNDKNLKKIRFEELYLNNCKGNIYTEDNTNNEDLEDWYGNRVFYNYFAQGNNDETFIDINNQSDPDYRLKIDNIKASTKAN